MAYPSSIDVLTPKTDDVDDVMAQDINELQTAVEAIETELGTDPAGTLTDVKTRLAISISDAGYLQFQAPTGLTISSGAVTVSRNVHTLDTEGSAASDDLETINGGAAGFFLMLRAVHADRTVIIKHGTGNIYCSGGVDISLEDVYNLALGYYDGNLNKWLIGVMGSSSGPSASPSASTSPSASVSPSSSVSPSVSPSASVSPSSSLSPSAA